MTGKRQATHKATSMYEEAVVQSDQQMLALWNSRHQWYKLQNTFHRNDHQCAFPAITDPVFTDPVLIALPDRDHAKKHAPIRVRLLNLNHIEVIPPCPTVRTDPVLRHIYPAGTRCQPLGRRAGLFVVNPPTHDTHVFLQAHTVTRAKTV